jgi:type III secretion protein L
MLSVATVIDKRKLAAAAGPLVKAETFVALTDAREIVAQAHRQADAIKSEMQEKVEKARSAGYDAGMIEARTEFSASIVSTIAELEAAFTRLEVRIVNTVMSGLQQILGRIDERTVMEQLVRRVLNEARERKQLRLRVAASQYDEVNGWLSDVIKEYPDIEFVDVMKDASAAHGTCVLESEFGAIDASLEVQLAAVRRGLVSAFIEKRIAASAAKEMTQ